MIYKATLYLHKEIIIEVNGDEYKWDGYIIRRKVPTREEIDEWLDKDETNQDNIKFAELRASLDYPEFPMLCHDLVNFWLFDMIFYYFIYIRPEERYCEVKRDFVTINGKGLVSLSFNEKLYTINFDEDLSNQLKKLRLKIWNCKNKIE
jgi:hypothetical protein